jgi:hypothetical protein
MCSVATHGTPESPYPLTQGISVKYIAKDALIEALIELDGGCAPSATLVGLGICGSTATRVTNNYTVRPTTAFKISHVLDRKMPDLFEVYRPKKHGSVRQKAGRVIPLRPAGPAKPKPKPAVDGVDVIDLAGPNATMSIADGVLTLRIKLADYSGEDIAYLMARFGGK